jgi:hypothetical protein
MDGNEFGTIIRAQMGGNSACSEKFCQTFLDIFMVKVSFHPDRQTFAGVFVDHDEDPKSAPIMSSFQHEVITPDMIRILWS